MPAEVCNKIIGRRKCISFCHETQIIDTFWRSIVRMVLTSYMIRHEIKYYFQSDFMRTGYQRSTPVLAPSMIFGRQGYHVAIVIRRPGYP